MDRIAGAILDHKRTVLIVFLGLLVISLIFIPQVQINYKLSDYLPEDAPSTQAMAVLNESLGQSIPNLTMMVRNLTIPQALALKTQIRAVSGVEDVLWLDDVIDVYEPLAMADSEQVEPWYRDGTALFSVTVTGDKVVDTVARLRELIGDDGALAGDAANRAEAQSTVMSEIPKILLFVIPLVLLILLISTSSWFEPVIFLAVIGVAILINEGTNILMGEISFITRATSAILQLAVSMDYAVFLLHRFARYRGEGMDLRQAMQKAMIHSFSAIAASAATTVLGFMALVLMRFKIGPDMGWVLAKGVLISFLSVVILLPVLALYTTRIMDKTHHRSLLPSFAGFGRFVMRICIPLCIVVMLLVVPAYLAQRKNVFVYGSSGMLSEGSQLSQDTQQIADLFGQSVQMVLLVPEGDDAREAALAGALQKVGKVNSVISYATAVGNEIPDEFLDPDLVAQFRSGGYSRLILSVGTADEGEEAFAAVEAVRSVSAQYYGDEYLLVGQSVVNYDLMDTITGDNIRVTLAAVVGIGFVLLLTFKSLSIPLLLLLAIEGATWLNLGIPYMTGDSLNYIGYQIISAVQLGATVDYGILFVQWYMTNRQTMNKRDAARAAVTVTAASILTPAGILAIAGLMLGFVSSNGIISQLGAILGRGAIVSSMMVLLVLPALLMIFDGVIRKTTMKARK